MSYVLAKKLVTGVLYACGEYPGAVNAGFSIDCAKHFESPGEALEFRAGMEPRWQREFIVHEIDGSLLHSLDV